SERLFKDIQPEKYPAKYDRRHDLTIVGSYDINKNWTIGFSFIFASGNTLTLPSSWYFHNQNLLFEYGKKNSTRMAPYHRLDFSATWYDNPTKLKVDKATGKTIEVKKKFRQNVAISVYNVYNRANPYFLYIDNDGSLTTNDFKIAVKQVSLFPILPSVTWNFEF
ncbi:MAG TPA: TonB-dependent receptor, partial [Fluviicola sp.]|nr:TonB-dependent receptor [Fluviicola sp.]